MEMLSCGEACRAVELLKDCEATGEAVPIDAGPSGAAGLAGLVSIERR
jgi:hypothetical protein